MSDFDLLVRGDEQDIGISDGKFVALGRNLSARRNWKSMPRPDNFPGVIEPTFISTSRAAPTGKVSRPARARLRPAEQRPCSRCR